MATVAVQEMPVKKKRPVAKLKPKQKTANSRTTTKLTLEEAEKLAAGKPYELIDGRMVFKMPDLQHANTQARLCIALGNFFETNTIGLVLTEFTHRLWPDKPHEGRVPDISVILNKNFQEGERYATRAPDIAIEIISRDDVWTELFDKAKLYLEKGSRQVWFIDPYEKAMLIVTSEDRRWVGETLTCPEILPDFSLDIQDLFSWPVK